MTGDWIPIDAMIAYRWDRAESRRMQRTPEDIEARDRALVRCRIRCLLARLRMWS